MARAWGYPPATVPMKKLLWKTKQFLGSVYVFLGGGGGNGTIQMAGEHKSSAVTLLFAVPACCSLLKQHLGQAAETFYCSNPVPCQR